MRDRGWSGRRAVQVLTAILFVLAAFGTTAAYAKPPTATSYYWTTTSTTVAEEDGCLQGITDALGNTNSEVILDFGGQLGNLSGTESIGGTVDFTNAQIEAIALAFGAGYFVCTEGENTYDAHACYGHEQFKGSR
ncbi:MAG: hypothetical protein WA484_16115 [Solirubrobacteraceae bacterium]